MCFQFHEPDVLQTQLPVDMRKGRTTESTSINWWRISLTLLESQPVHYWPFGQVPEGNGLTPAKANTTPNAGNTCPKGQLAPGSIGHIFGIHKPRNELSPPLCGH
jgi:hypothetical protein